MWLGPPSSQGPPMFPAEGGPKILKLKPSWHQRRRSKNLAVSLKHWKGRRGGGVSRGVHPPPLLLRCTAVLIHHWGRVTAAIERETFTNLGPGGCTADEGRDAQATGHATGIW